MGEIPIFGVLEPTNTARFYSTGVVQGSLSGAEIRASGYLAAPGTRRMKVVFFFVVDHIKSCDFAAVPQFGVIETCRVKTAEACAQIPCGYPMRGRHPRNAR